MKITLDWLKEHLDTDASADEIGKTPEDLRPEVLLRLYRGTTMVSCFELDHAGCLQQDDTLLLLAMAAKPTR